MNGIDKFGSLSYIYDVVDIGLKYDINSINAAFSIAQLEKTDELIKRRKRSLKFTIKSLKSVTTSQLQSKNASTSTLNISSR